MARSIRSLRIAGAVGVVALCCIQAASAQTVCREDKVTAFDGGVFQSFGYSVAVSGDTAMIGAQWDNDNGTQSGSVYVYQREPDREGSWVFTQKLLASDGTTNNRFGSAVTIDGDVIVVGAFGHFHDDDSGSGSAYVFRFDNDTSMWIEEQELLASDGETGDKFGFSVVISGDVAVIGAMGDDDNGGQSGSAYVFRYHAKSRLWIEEQKLLASDGAAGDFFGDAVAIVADPAGDVALIGAGGHDDLGNNAGAAYVYRFDPKTAAWQEEQKLLASDGAASHVFGLAAVSLSGIEDKVAVIGADGNGTGRAYVFRYDPKNSTWFEEQKLVPSGGAPQQFGRAAAIDGKTALIGSWAADAVGTNSGAAYVYRYDRDTSQWSQEDMLVPDRGPWAAWFGWSVALDGDRAVCGADGENQQAGAAYMFAGLEGIDCNNNGVSDSCEKMDPDVCPWDLDGDEIVGVSDLLALLAAWGAAPCAPSDFNNDGAVGVSDLLALLANWGVCP